MLALLMASALLLDACVPARPDAAKSTSAAGCVQVAGVIDNMRWAPDDRSLVLAVTRVDGSGEIDRLDAAALTLEELKTGVQVVPDTLDAGDNGIVYFRQLADPSLLSIDASTTQVVLTPPFEVWSYLAWSRRRLFMVNDGGAQADVTAVDPETGRSDAVFTTQDRIDSLWTDPDGTAVLIAHAPYPEIDLDAGSTFTLIRGDQQANVTLARLNVATTASMSPDLAIISFVESNAHRLGSLALSDGTIEWIATDLDGAEISARGRLATFSRTDDPTSDRVCVQ
jgi:hypothetical protein